MTAERSFPPLTKNRASSAFSRIGDEGGLEPEPSQGCGDVSRVVDGIPELPQIGVGSVADDEGMSEALSLSNQGEGEKKHDSDKETQGRAH